MGYDFFAPGVIVSEVLYVLCGKLQTGVLTPSSHAQAVQDFQTFMTFVLGPPNGDGSLVLRAEAIRTGFSCRRSADGIYIALAEEPAVSHSTILITLDQDTPKQAARNAPGIHVHLIS